MESRPYIFLLTSGLNLEGKIYERRRKRAAGPHTVTDDFSFALLTMSFHATGDIIPSCHCRMMIALYVTQ